MAPLQEKRSRDPLGVARRRKLTEYVLLG